MTHYFVKRGYHVSVVSRRLTLFSEIGLDELKNINFLKGDINSLQELPTDIEVVIHVAATSPDENIKTQDFIYNNVLATEKLVQLSLKAGVKKFIFFSSLSVYGDIQTSLVDESTPIINPNPYGISKLLNERSLKDYARELPSISFRLPAVLGFGAKRHWLANTVDKARRGEPIAIFNPKALFNNAVHVHDLSLFIEDLIHQKLEGAEVMTLASNGYLSIEDIIGRVKKATTSNAPIIIDQKSTHSFMISNKKAVEDFGFRPRTFEQVLDEYLTEITAIV